MRKTLWLLTGVVLTSTLIAGPIAVPALAGKPSGSSGSTFKLVVLDSTDGVAHYGKQVTFEVSTTATDKPMVKLDCYQGTTYVYWSSAGFYADYPWPWARNFTLNSSYWTGGAADCIAELYYTKDGRRFTTLSKINFHAEA